MDGIVAPGGGLKRLVDCQPCLLAALRVNLS
jgi:hypothetical protein